MNESFTIVVDWEGSAITYNGLISVLVGVSEMQAI